MSTPETPRDNIAAPPRDSEQVPSHFRGRLRLAEVDDSLRIIWKAGGRAGCHGNRFPTSLPKDALEGSGRAWQWLLPQNTRRPRPPREGGGATEKGAEPPIPDRVPATAGAQRRCPHLPACHHHHCPGLVASQQPRELTEGESSLSPGPGAGGGTVTTPRFLCLGRFSPGRPRGRRQDRRRTLHESKTDRACS